MELKAFIEETLCQIAEAMNGAQSRLEYLGVNINPPYMVEEGEYVDASHRSSTVHCLQKVDFDIAVTASSGMKKDSELSISVLAAKLGGAAATESVNSAVSRIRFQLVVRMPQGKFEGM